MGGSRDEGKVAESSGESASSTQERASRRGKQGEPRAKAGQAGRVLSRAQARVSRSRAAHKQECERRATSSIISRAGPSDDRARPRDERPVRT